MIRLGAAASDYDESNRDEVRVADRCCGTPVVNFETSRRKNRSGESGDCVGVAR